MIEINDAVAGALSGALAVSSVGIVGQVIGNAAISIGNYWAAEGENATLTGTIESATIGAIGGKIGGAGLNLKRQVGVIKYSKAVLSSLKSPKRIGMYMAKITTATQSIKSAARQFARATSVTSVMGNVKNKVNTWVRNIYRELTR